jgi:hypothetical protein
VRREIHAHWIPVEQDLAELWVNASDRQAVTDAANLIDRLLTKDPLNVGESRDGNTRILIVPPLAVYYDVILDDHRVLIWQVWRWGP